MGYYFFFPRRVTCPRSLHTPTVIDTIFKSPPSPEKIESRFISEIAVFRQRQNYTSGSMDEVICSEFIVTISASVPNPYRRTVYVRCPPQPSRNILSRVLYNLYERSFIPYTVTELNSRKVSYTRVFVNITLARRRQWPIG